MNLPNRLSILRMAMVPVLVALMYVDLPVCHVLSLIVFIVASLTDFLDGYIARKQHIITDFGKFIDPVADKLLVLSAFIMLCHQDLMVSWVVILILARELCVDALRMIAVSKGKVIAAGWLGKVKTVSQMVLTIWLMVFRQPVMNHWFTIVGTVWVAAITLWSGVDYFARNGKVLFEDEK